MKKSIFIFFVLVSFLAQAQLKNFEIKAVPIGQYWQPIDTITQFVVEPIEGDTIKEWIRLPEERPNQNGHVGEYYSNDTLKAWRPDFIYAIYEDRTVVLFQKVAIYRQDSVFLTKQERIIKALKIGKNLGATNNQFWNYVEKEK